MNCETHTMWQVGLFYRDGAVRTIAQIVNRPMVVVMDGCK